MSEKVQPKDAKAKSPRTLKQPEELSYEEVQERFKGKLLLIRPTEVNEHRQWTRGEIILVGSRAQVLRKLAHLIETEPRPKYPYQMFAAGVWSRSFEEAAKLEVSQEDIEAFAESLNRRSARRR